MKLSALAFANAAALSGAILWVICSLVAIVLPDVYQAGVSLLALGAGIGHVNIGLDSVVVGGVLFTVIAWFSGYVFGWSLERVSKKK